MAPDNVTRPRAACKVCGVDFEKRRRGPSRYCGEECRRSVERKSERARDLARGGVCPGSVIPCLRCEIPTLVGGPAQKYCAACRRLVDAEKAARWRVAHPEKVRALQKAHDEARRDDPARRKSLRQSQAKRDARVRATPRGKLDHRMGQMVRRCLSGGKGGRKWETLLGYSLDELIAHIERQFVRGMIWENISKWHIDHIVPQASFSYTSAEEPEFKACWALTNLRPLWAHENQSKSAKRLYLL